MNDSPESGPRTPDRITLRVPPEERAAWEEDAKALRLSLSAYIRKAMQWGPDPLRWPGDAS